MNAGNSGATMPYGSSNLYDFGANVNGTTALPPPDYLMNSDELYGEDPSHELFDLGVMDGGQYNVGNGMQLDLFDGFFFGNAGSYSSGM